MAMYNWFSLLKIVIFHSFLYVYQRGTCFIQDCPIPMVDLQWDEEVYEVLERLDFASKELWMSFSIKIH